MNYIAILKGKYPAKAHARRVVDLIRQQKPDANGVLYLEGRTTKLLEDNDEPEPFRCVPLLLSYCSVSVFYCSPTLFPL